MEPEEEEEEEDLDFIPFLREDLPSDASSGVTSENEGAGPPLPKSFVDEGNKDNSSLEGQTAKSTPCVGVDLGPPAHTGLTTGVSKGEEEDAICKRTRARVSLENYSLDELEAFLQESDEDGEGQNVDEEEEYRRFLAAVLTDELPYNTEEVGVADEDENDADFELEIEEALESDHDEPVDITVNEAQGRGTRPHRRPETRQKKRLKEPSSDNNWSDLAMALTRTAPLRPLIPYTPPGQAMVASVSTAPTVPAQSYGFTAQQIGQLYVMLHEHVQLLLQVFSVSVLDPAHQKVAAESQNLIKEMVAKREEALTGKAVAFPESCFSAPYLCPSRSSSANGRPKSTSWVPSIDGPIFSLLDVMPLRLAKDYLEDVMATVIRYRQRHLESTIDESYTKREPLFPMPKIPITRTGHSRPCLSSMPDNGQQKPKKTLAATLVEGSLKQTVALVPIDIVKLAQRFYPLFNLEMLPHKPPVAAVANRVLFTDAEDELLAMGLLDYNNDWGAIQKHYLPCKSKHQIFVRQKNRCSSKAPDNTIKAVRRMKTSPLRPDEIDHIQEGLKLYKNDWSLVWKLVVPHRDPSLLPRQWRIATGTQKSYAKSQVNREKRRRYEAQRRRKIALMADSENVNAEEFQENETDKGLNGEYENDNNAYEEEAYVHEAFLADSEYRNDSNTNSIPQEGTGPCISNPTNTIQSLAPLNSRSSTLYASSTGRALVSLPIRRNKGYRVVKLAPDLPPVNLPPSVRVISRAIYNASQTPATKATSLSKDDRPKQLDLFPYSNQNNNSQTEPDFQMHPLLFQATPEQQLGLYQPNVTRPMNDTSSSGFHEIDKEVSGDSRTLGFHYLLQRVGTDEGLDSRRVFCGERGNIDLNIRLFPSTSGAKSNTLRESLDANEGLRLEVGNAFSREQRTEDLGAEAQNSSSYQKSGALLINEDSMQGIVMEQEELSDSDDGGDDSRHVEFECEEMADSDDDQLQYPEALVGHNDKSHPLEQTGASIPFHGLNQEKSRGPKRRKGSTKDGNLQNNTESRSRKGKGRGTKIAAQLHDAPSKRPITGRRKPPKRPALN